MAANKVCSLFLLLAVVLGSLSPAPAAADSVLYPGGSLLDGRSLTQGSFVLVMQRDCNLVLYYGSRPVWASQTYGWGPGCRATIQRDGNFVVSTATGRPLWASGTLQRAIGNYVLVLKPDGDVVIYSGAILWATGINGGGVTTAPPVPAKWPTPPAWPKYTPLPLCNGAPVQHGGRHAICALVHPHGLPPPDGRRHPRRPLRRSLVSPQGEGAGDPPIRHY